MPLHRCAYYWYVHVLLKQKYVVHYQCTIILCIYNIIYYTNSIHYVQMTL